MDQNRIPITIEDLTQTFIRKQKRKNFLKHFLIMIKKKFTN